MAFKPIADSSWFVTFGVTPTDVETSAAAVVVAAVSSAPDGGGISADLEFIFDAPAPGVDDGLVDVLAKRSGTRIDKEMAPSALDPGLCGGVGPVVGAPAMSGDGLSGGFLTRGSPG